MKRWLKRLGAGLFVFALLTAVVAVYASGHKKQFSAFSRATIGMEATSEWEHYVFVGQDYLTRFKYEHLGGSDNSFTFAHATPVFAEDLPAYSSSSVMPEAIVEEVVPQAPQGPAPMYLPPIDPLFSDTNNGEGVWRFDGLPNPTDSDPLIAKALIRTSNSRGYANVQVLLIDHRRVAMRWVGGSDNGGQRTIPVAEQPYLVAAMNGGFRLQHGEWGMKIGNTSYKNLRDGYPTLAILPDGSVQMGRWGQDFGAATNPIAVRQNGRAFLVENCAVGSRINENNDTWGYVDPKGVSQYNITWRSAIGLTQYGDIVLAAGIDIDQKELAKALVAAGACTALQMDINSPYVLIDYFYQDLQGKVVYTKFMGSARDVNPGKFFSGSKEDFLYLLRDEQNYQ